MLQRDGIFSSSSFVQANLVAAARQHNKCAFNRAGGGDPSVMLFFFAALGKVNDLVWIGYFAGLVVCSKQNSRVRSSKRDPILTSDPKVGRVVVVKWSG